MGNAYKKTTNIRCYKNVGGKKRTLSAKKETELTVKKVLEKEFPKSDVSPTILRTCSFKSGENIHTIENPVIKSISKGKKQHVCFIVTGKEKIDKQEDLMKDLPEKLRELKIGKKEEHQCDDAECSHN